MTIVDVDEVTFAAIPAPAMDGTCQDCVYWQGQVQGDRPELRRRLFGDGTLLGKLALDDSGAGVGFIQYGSLAAFPTFADLRREFPVELVAGAWVITCVMTHKGSRRRGVARRLLQAVVDQARGEGRTIEAVGMEQADLEHMSLGPAQLYRQAGFQELARFTDSYGVNVLLRLES